METFYIYYSHVAAISRRRFQQGKKGLREDKWSQVAYDVAFRRHIFIERKCDGIYDILYGHVILHTIDIKSGVSEICDPNNPSGPYNKKGLEVANNAALLTGHIS